jgi:hypothetical protein
MMADEISSEYRPIIASLLNLLALEYDYETAFSWSTTTSSS